MDTPLAVLGPDAITAADWPLHDCAASRAIEQRAAAQLPPHALMQRAGRAAARLALALAPHARRVWVAAGPGNNGGDGLEAALHLQAAGKQVTVALADGRALPADAAAALARAQAAGVAVVASCAAPAALDATDLAIDALFGLGLSRAPEGWAARAVAALNAGPAPVLALDVPSGLAADHGSVFAAGTAVRARWTLGLLTLKPGLFTAEGRDHAGAVWFDDLGVPAGNADPVATLLGASDALWPARPHASHKGRYGDVWVVGGAPGMGGAARLAARAALVAGAGRVLLVPLDGAGDGCDAHCPELMLRTPAALCAAAVPLERATVVCGCGGGDAVREPLPTLLARSGRLLLDADALNAVATDPALAALLRARAARRRPTLLTPHPLEAARLLGCDGAALQSDRLGAARRLAERHGCWVVLKGSGSIVAGPGATPSINASGNAALASAGSGDVLAGWIGGLWSQGLEIDRAARLGVHGHGLAADRWQAGQRHPGALPASALLHGLAALGSA